MKSLLNTMGATIKGSFACKGRFLLLNRGRPNNDDIKQAQEFAQEMK
jgi:hypothetical protein